MAPQVYVVDDSVSVCFAIERMLRARGFEVVSERSGKAALRDLETRDPDLVLLDLVLPDIDGLKICAFMRNHERLAKVPVIVISGILDDEVRSEALRIGAVGVLKKPFATEDLVSMVEKVLSDEPTAGHELLTADPDAPLPDLRGEETAPKPDPEAFGRLEGELEPFAGLETVRFACLVHASGTVRGFGAAKPAANATSSLLAAVQGAAMSVAALGYGAAELLTVETEDGILLLLPQDGGWVLAVGIGEESDLGKARYLIRRIPPLI
ncbi:MAG: response regulator [Acidobacteriota bacterium]